MKVRVILDGIETQFLNDVKVIVEAFDPDQDNVDLHLTLTHEGMISDVVLQNDVYATSSTGYAEMVPAMDLPGCAVCGALINDLSGGGEDGGVICPHCRGWFCDNHYNCAAGDGCHCHAQVDVRTG